MEIRKRASYWLSALLVALFGVLFIVIGANQDQDVVRTLDIIIGVLFTLEGACAILISLLVKKRFVSPLSLSGALSLALGIYCFVQGFIYTFLAVFLDFVPFLLIVVGSLLVLQALLTFALSKKKNLVLFIVQLVYGAIILTFGILLLTVFDEMSKKHIILGIVLCVFATYLILGSFVPQFLVITVATDGQNQEANDAEEVEVVEENTGATEDTQENTEEDNKEDKE